ncbi:MAG: hypothetical protein P4M09_18150 [Devosia sp.]|nr:hypothetical protein [Devosia sp.]
MPLSIATQDRRIRQLYPKFRLVLDCGFMGVWEGPLTPVNKTYTIRITYLAYNVFDGFFLGNPIESVIVLDPPVGHDPRGTGERAQHVYYWDRHPDFPRLCLHDPVAGDWNWNMYIAETLIPFTIDWLLWHEDWVATGVWRGKGRHPEAPSASSSNEPEAISDYPGASTARLRLDVAFHRLATRAGLAGAYHWMSSSALLFFHEDILPAQASGDQTAPPARLAA